MSNASFRFRSKFEAAHNVKDSVLGKICGLAAWKNWLEMVVSDAERHA